MTKSYARALSVVLALFSSLLASCERVDDINGFSERPRYALEGDYRLLDPQSTEPGTPVSVSAEVRSSEDATLTVGKYSLYIPQGSVKKSTTFVMTVDGTTVDLRAIEHNGRFVTQFPNGLRLTLPYDQFQNVGNPSNLVLAYVVPNNGSYQIAEALAATADVANQTITGSIYHFSIYTVAKEIIVGID